MSRRLSGIVLSELSGFLASEMGLHFPPERWRDLERGLRAAAIEFQIPDVEACARWLLSSPLSQSQIEVLASHLTVGETYFFRDQRTFEALEHHILPALAQEGRRCVRIWSAGCCSGEEPYSIAISLRRVFSGPGDWDLTILGSDINPGFLHKAHRGIFSEWSFRNTPASLKRQHFKALGKGRWEILPEIKQMVHFRHLNLAEDVYPSPLNGTQSLDVIFCRNVLIYFSTEQANSVLKRFRQCLREGGWLVLSPSETPHVSIPGFVPVNLDGTILYRKDGTRVAPQPQGTHVSVPAPSKPEPALPPPAFLSPPQAPSGADLGTVAPPIVAFPPVHKHPVNGRGGEAVVLHGAKAAEPDIRQAMQRARAEADRGHLVEALRWCDQALEDNKLDTSAHYLRASILQELGDVEAAVAALKRVLYLDPEFLLAHFALGNLARSQRRFAEAEKHFSNVLALTRARPPDEILLESDGLTVSRLYEITTALIDAGKSAK